jgi:hypothetical protein
MIPVFTWHQHRRRCHLRLILWHSWSTLPYRNTDDSRQTCDTRLMRNGHDNTRIRWTASEFPQTLSRPHQIHNTPLWKPDGMHAATRVRTLKSEFKRLLSEDDHMACHASSTVGWRVKSESIPESIEKVEFRSIDRLPNPRHRTTRCSPHSCRPSPSSLRGCRRSRAS